MLVLVATAAAAALRFVLIRRRDMVAIADELDFNVAKSVVKLRFHYKTNRVAVVHNVRILQLIQSQTE